MPLRLALPLRSRSPTSLHPFILLTSFLHSPPSSPPLIRRMLTNSPPSRCFSDLRDWGEGREEGGWLAAWGRGDPVFCQGVPPSNPAPHPGPPPPPPSAQSRVLHASPLRALSALRRTSARGPEPGSTLGEREGGSGERRGSAAGRGKRGEKARESRSDPAGTAPRPLPPASLP